MRERKVKTTALFSSHFFESLLLLILSLHLINVFSKLIFEEINHTVSKSQIRKAITYARLEVLSTYTISESLPVCRGSQGMGKNQDILRT